MTLASRPALVPSKDFKPECCLTRAGKKSWVVRTALPFSPNLGGWPPFYHPLPRFARTFSSALQLPTLSSSSKSSHFAHPNRVFLCCSQRKKACVLWEKAVPKSADPRQLPLASLARRHDFLTKKKKKKGKNTIPEDASHFTAFSRHAIFPFRFFSGVLIKNLLETLALVKPSRKNCTGTPDLLVWGKRFQIINKSYAINTRSHLPLPIRLKAFVWKVNQKPNLRKWKI